MPDPRAIASIKDFLKDWPTIPSAYAEMVKTNPNESFPSLRTFQYHAQKVDRSARVGGRDLYRPHGRRRGARRPKRPETTTRPIASTTCPVK